MVNEILKHAALKRFVKEVFQKNNTEVLERPHSFIIRSINEGADTVTRIIVLPPYGYTGNTLDELNSHDEVRKAKITVRGILREEKENFSLVKNCLSFSYLTKREARTENGVPYALASDNENIHQQKPLSSKETLYVVKENGEGFYHNLINTTDEPLVLLLKKELRSGKQMNILKKTVELKLSISPKRLIFKLFKKIKEHGDDLFNIEADMVEKVLDMEVDDLLPILIEGLNIYETGKHEPCTVYALLLKKAKLNKASALKYLKSAIKNNSAPHYYLNELIRKLDPDPSALNKAPKSH
ncbi:MAG: hypothetical protein AAB460_02895 [Patescibacteria group bacterium]